MHTGSPGQLQALARPSSITVAPEYGILPRYRNSNRVTADVALR
jgi:hypothetical protein